ncbi:MAG: hypothetical protein AAGM67_06140, partial [Bacteroidota bacterium]
MKKLASPYQIAAEYRFIYDLNVDLQLVGTQWFASQQKARAEARKSLRLLIEPTFLQQSAADLAKDACLELKGQEQVIARSPKEAKSASILAGLQKWADALNNIRLLVKVDSWPDQWQFHYFWSGQGRWERLLESGQAFESPEEAAAAYVEFIKRLPGLSLQIDEGTESFGLLDDENPLAQSIDFQSAAEKDQAISWLEQSRQHQGQMLSLSTIEGPVEGEVPEGLEAYIRKTATSEQGTFGYQVIRKEEPMAVLLTEQAQCTDQQCQSYWESVREAETGPEIPLNGEVYRLVDGLFHFEIRWLYQAQEQLWFVSAAGYASAAAAIEALQAEYIRMMGLACDPANYAKSLEDREASIVFGAPDDVQSSCPPNPLLGPQLYVPLETLALFEDDLASLRAYTTRIAGQFPLKVQQYLCDDNQPSLLSEERFYFQLTMGGGEFVQHWQSFASYESPKAVWEAWCEFLYWKDQRTAYHCFEDWADSMPCLKESRQKNPTLSNIQTATKEAAQYCAIYEVLLESSHRHQQEDVWQTGPVESSNAAPKLGILSLSHYGAKKEHYLIHWDYYVNAYRLRVGT